MNKLYFFIEPTGYNKYIAAAANGSDIAFYFKGFSNAIERILIKWHNAWPLNKKRELPFKGYWFRKYVKSIPRDIQYILMAESFHLSYSKQFIKKLRKRYPQVKICFMFSNPVGSYNISKVKAMKREYDAIITFAKDDAINYNFYYCDALPMRLPEPDPSLSIEYDVFFVGKDKGRLGKINDIFDKLQSLGLKCKFYIVGVPESEQRQTGQIVYNTHIQYDEVLNFVQKSRCVLEVLQEGCSYVSLKTIEAIHYHKKLLTTNPNADESILYSPEFIRIIRNTDDIDLDFINREMPDDTFNKTKLVESYDSMIIFLDELFAI